MAPELEKETKPRPGGHKRKKPGPVPGQRFEITVPQCKICQLNPHVRWNIEMELTTGWTQKATMDRWNVFLFEDDPEKYGEAYLNKANLSGHFTKHTTTKEMAIRHIVEESARSFGKELEAVAGLIITKQAIAESVAVSGLQAIAKGEVMVEPRETLQAVELLREMEQDQEGPALDELWRQFYAYRDAVTKIVPPELNEAIVAEFDRQLRGVTYEVPVLTRGPVLAENLDAAAARVAEVIEEAEYVE